MEPPFFCKGSSLGMGRIILSLGKSERIILSGGIKHQRVMAALLDDTPTVDY